MSDDDDLATEVRRLRSEVDALRRRVDELEAAEGDPLPSEDEASPEDAETPTEESDTASPPDDESDAPRPSDETAGSTGDRTTGRRRDWERDLGIRWLGLVGGVALVVGVVFFVRLAIETGVLGPLGRVAAGTIGGLTLFVGGRFAAERQGYVRWGRIAAGVGLAIAYFSLYAAYGFEAYRAALGTPLWAVLLALTGLVAGTVAVSVRDRAPIVAGEAFTLGYVTAFLGLEAGTFVVTPAYALLLAVGLVGIATVRPWSRLVAASVLPTYGVVWAWVVDVDPAMALVAGVVVATFGIYLVGGYVLRRSDADGRWHLLLVRSLTVLNAAVAASLLEFTVREWVPDAPVEGVAVAAVGLALVGVYAFTDRRPVRRDETAGALAVVLFASAVVLATGTFAATVGLLAVLCGAVLVASLRDADAFRTGAHLVAIGVAYKLLVEDAHELPAFDLSEPLATATGRPVAFALAILAFYGLALRFRTATVRPSRSNDPIPLAAPYALAGTGLTIVLLGLELAGVGVSVAWAVFGLALVTGGLLTDSRGLRLQGVAVFGLVTAKVFLFDTQDLDAVARVLAFLVLGAVLLVASYAYARWQGEDPFRRLTSD